MANLQVIYGAPLPPGFISGTLTLKRSAVYIDKDGRKAVPLQQAIINGNGTLTDRSTGQPLYTVAAGPGDPAGGMLTWVETLNISGVPIPVTSTKDIPATWTAPGQLDLHKPNFDAPLTGSANDAYTLALQATQQAQVAAATVAQMGSFGTTLNGLQITNTAAAPFGGTVITLTTSPTHTLQATAQPAPSGGVLLNLESI